jgi:hypothetical protein
VAIADVAAIVASLPADARVVLVDRDGSLAFAVAGGLMNSRSDRVLRVLHGGLQSYHQEVVLRGGRSSMTAPPAAAMSPPSPTNTATPSPTPTPTKKRSAGC